MTTSLPLKEENAAPVKPWMKPQANVNQGPSLLDLLQTSEGPVSWNSSAFQEHPSMQHSWPMHSPYGAHHNYSMPTTFQLPEHIFNPNSSLGALELKGRHMLQTVATIVRAFGGVIQLMDSTVYAGWSSLMALSSVAQSIDQLSSQHLSKWISLLKQCLIGFLQLIGASSGRIKDSQKTIAKRPTWQTWILPAAIAIGSYYVIRRLYNSKQEESKHVGMRARTVHYFDGSDLGEQYLETFPGDDLVILSSLQNQNVDNSEWLLVKRLYDQQQGLVPSSHVQILASQL